MTREEKILKLKSILSDSGSAVIACSGGTDSIFLLYTASKIKKLRLMAVSVKSPYMHSEEIAEAEKFCSDRLINHRVVEMAFPEGIRNNPENRCYLCKREILALILLIAEEGKYINVFDGTNADDINDYRPGLKALKEAGVRSPLLEAGLTKAEIRELSREEGLNTWDKPANACLLTRFPHNTVIESGELRKVEKAEKFIESIGLNGSRVRVQGDLTRIECREGQIETAVTDDNRERIINYFKSLGYKYITIDLEGYITGRMNLKKE